MSYFFMWALPILGLSRIVPTLGVMASPIHRIEKTWVINFRRSPLVDLYSGTIKKEIAKPLLYGKGEGDLYPAEYPHNFYQLYRSFDGLPRKDVVDKVLRFLGFAGIRIDRIKVDAHLTKYPEDLEKVVKKTFFILRTFALNSDHITAANPFQENSGDIYFFLRIESGESIHGGQLSFFEDMDLPNLYSRFSGLPANYGEDAVVRSLFARIENGNESFFITGKAGTGKSTFIHYFAQKTKKTVLLTAFTGIASINIGGQTLHSLFRFPFKPLMPEDPEITKFPENSERYKLFTKTDTFVIDEVSMLRADVLEAIDYSLRTNGGDKTKRFGGKQLIFVGDIFQLPPVVDSTDEVERFLFSNIYRSEYFFDSLAYKALSPVYFEFTKSFRQKDDLPFVECLDKIRICEVGPKELKMINDRYAPSYVPKKEEFTIMLTANNALADQENTRRLRELQYLSFPKEAAIQGNFPIEKFPTAKILELKKYAQIVLLKNNSARRWVNGTIAKIEFISNDVLEIRLQDGSLHTLEKATWENRRYKYNKEQRKVVSEVIGTFVQYPIKLAWAITIHKSQGLTFDKVNIDLGAGAFVNGQAYTALSRCRSLKGITLKRMLKKEDVIADQRILNFYQTEQTLKNF